MSFTIVIAPSGFKESLSVNDVIRAIGHGVRTALPDARILEAPMLDGGEGFTQALVNATCGTLHQVTVTGPVGMPVLSFFGIMGGTGPRIAVLEMAAAAGLLLVPRTLRDPGLTTSYGVGQLIRRAMDQGLRRILVEYSDSGINDGGAGMAQALGARLLDADGEEIDFGGYGLSRRARIDLSGMEPWLAEVPSTRPSTGTMSCWTRKGSACLWPAKRRIRRSGGGA